MKENEIETPGEVTAAETELREVEEAETQIRELKEACVEKARQVVADGLKAARTRVLEDEAPARVQAETRSDRLSPVVSKFKECSDYRYTLLPEWQRDMRSPEGDHAIWKWINAARNRDTATMRQVCEETRATTLAVGAPGTPIADGSGGALVPQPLANIINTVLYRRARMRSLATLVTSPNNTLAVPVQDASSTTSWIAEGGSFDTDGSESPNYSAAVQLRKQKLTNFSVITAEMLADSSFAVASWVTDDVSRNIAAQEDVAFCTGSGVDPNPKGFEIQDTVAGSQANEIALTANTIDYAKLLSMMFTLGEGYRQNAVWMCNDHVLSLLSQLVDTNGRSIFNFADRPAALVGDEFTAPGAIGTVLGRPIYNLPMATSAAGTADTDRLYLSDIRRHYLILTDGGVRMDVSSEFGFSTDTIGIRTIVRVDGGPWSTSTDAYRAYVWCDGINAV